MGSRAAAIGSGTALRRGVESAEQIHIIAMHHLYIESFSPWSEKARWALDHHGVRYRAVEHVPLIGELRLRWVARQPFGRVSVPLLVANNGEEERLTDSLSIGRWAERVGSGEALFPANGHDAVEGWNRGSEGLMEGGRALLLPRLLASEEALREQLPAFMPPSLRSVAKPAAVMGVRYLIRKYGITTEQPERHEQIARETLLALRGVLASEGRYLVDRRFTYADIAMACALQFFSPVAEELLHLGPATRLAWTHASIADEFHDLVTWRDGLYVDHRAVPK